MKKAQGKLKDDGIENPPEEQEHRKNQLHIQQQKRLEEGSLDQQNIKEARVRKEEWIERDEILLKRYPEIQENFSSHVEYMNFKTGEEVNDFFYYDDPVNKGILQRKKSAYGKWKSKLTAGQKEAISSYTAGGYGDLNTFLRKTDYWKELDEVMMKEFASELSSAINDF